MYVNEKTGIITSLNLLSYSSEYSLEVGMKISSDDEYLLLKKYFEDFIKFEGSKFIGFSASETDKDINLCWFGSIPTVDMYLE